MKVVDQGKFGLCLILDDVAWFTEAPLDEQWGDDWDDAPHEHNAGEPYPYTREGRQPGVEGVAERVPHHLLRLKFDGPFELPYSDVTNWSWSVHDLNEGLNWWLRTSRGTEKFDCLMAGATPEEFCAFVRRNGGTVWKEDRT